MGRGLWRDLSLLVYPCVVPSGPHMRGCLSRTDLVTSLLLFCKTSDNPLANTLKGRLELYCGTLFFKNHQTERTTSLNNVSNIKIELSSLGR